jgi:(5-formylfuran-3-yl)methyl phosphate synthase
MRLLVSVRDADEADVAVEGGADIIDAKEPAQGALGAVSGETLQAINVAVAQRRPISAALGDFHEDPSGKAIARAGRAAVNSRTKIVKVGMDRSGVNALVMHCLSLIDVLHRELAPDSRCDLVLGTYADMPRSRDDCLHRVIDVAGHVRPAGARCRVAGVLLDTLSKDGRTLFDVMSVDRVAAWVRAAHEAELFVALAGSLDVRHVDMARDTGADIMGVRTAACDGGRRGRVSSQRVRRVARAIHAGHGYTPWAAIG